MSIALDGSTQFLSSANPQVKTQPIAVGIFFKANKAAFGATRRYLWSMTDGTAGPSNQYSIDATVSGSTLSPAMTMISGGGNSVVSFTPITVDTAATWWFALAIWHSATLRYGFLFNTSNLRGGGGSSASSVASVSAPTGLTNELIGGLQTTSVVSTTLWPGEVGEVWKLSGLAQLGLDTLTTTAAVTLMLNGPFYWPIAAQTVCDYHSLRKGPAGLIGEIGDDYSWSQGQQLWVPNGSSFITTDHPYITRGYEYVRPSPSKLILPI